MAMPGISIGILGGMGPEATHYFLNLLTRLTAVSKEQDHITYLLLSNPFLPDRSKAILSKDPLLCHDLIQALQDNVLRLEEAGAQCVVIPCNTAHYFSKEIQDALTIPFINMIALTASFFHSYFPNKKVGLLGTTATVQSGIYAQALAKYHIDCITPQKEDQATVMYVIYEVKNQQMSADLMVRLKTILDPIIQHLKNKGADFIILGCTELPLVVMQAPYLIDPMEILAIHCIQKSGKPSLKTEESLAQFSALALGNS